ncbi:MAG TPA: GvpL/GvpF family gas vesicle protein [Candidatus Koribacter sp.]|jgi:hypothetical protein
MATPVKKKAAAKKPAGTRAIYLYGIAQPSRKKVDIRTEAIDGDARIESVRLEGLDCWISRVDRGEYADHLAENMENLEWLATIGVRHQRAVADLAAKTEILPARFGTVFLTDESLKQHVAASKKSIQSVFRKISGSDEWGVKIFRHSQNVKPAMVEAASGTDYLKRKAQSVMPRAKEDDPTLTAFTQQLSKLSVETAAGGNASSGQPNLVWHGSFLVRRGNQKKFANALRDFTAQFVDAYRVECSGPWPPYSFVGHNV